MTEPAVAIARPPIAEPVLVLSADGRHLIQVARGELVIGGTRAPIDDVVAATLLDREVWCIARGTGGHRLERLTLDGTRIGIATALGELGDDARITSARRGMHALVSGQRVLEIRMRDDAIAVSELGPRPRDAHILWPGRGVLERRGGALVLLRSGTLAELSLALPADAPHSRVVGGGLLLDGAMVAVEIAVRDQHVVLSYDARRGSLLSRVRISDATVLAIAERAGRIVIGRDRHLALVELRSGRCCYEHVLAAPFRAVATDAMGTRVVIGDAQGQPKELGAMFDDGEPVQPAEVEPAEVEPAGVEPAEVEPAEVEPAGARPVEALASAPSEPEPSREEVADVTASDRELTEASALFLAALGPLPPHRGLCGNELDAYLGDLQAWLGTLCDVARVRASGEQPVDASTGACSLDDAATHRLNTWMRRGVPHIEIALDLRLSPLATSMLLVIAGPQIWGELARAYGVVTADNARPLVDELLLAHLLDAPTRVRSAIAAELDEGAPLVASGAVVIGAGLRPYAPLSVHPVIARRLAGAHTAADPHAPCALHAIVGPRAELAALARQLAAPTDRPARVVLRGRVGAGRRTVAAALAAQAMRALRPIAIDTRADVEGKLRRALCDATLCGDVPCVSLDEFPDDPAVHRQVCEVLDAHRAPLFVRAPLEGNLPLGPGYAVVDLPPLTEGQRRDVWRRNLAAHDLDGSVADELAARFPVGPGAVERVCSSLDGAARSVASPEVVRAITAKVRQHRAFRMSGLANRVARQATWNDLVVPEEIGESLRELVARVKYRRTVFETWGMDHVAATAQGVTAIFQGGPGTGKTMAAGVIANALGYELWRVDLSKVVSKWIGETEKNLARVFDAAEDGEVVLLFDEADSLFGKRTDVKSSNDRNANLETNYLLQRLDSFTGIAILTTNFGTAIDAAFKRRVSVQIQFPFPDENERELLWRAHLPPRLPMTDSVDLAALARRYQMSGGYIRNTALRAAYLAAADGTALAQDHLERAIKAVYRDQAKVTLGGRME